MTEFTMLSDELRDVVKGTIDGLHQFVDQEVVPLEREHQAVLADERKLFNEHGYLVPEIRQARDGVRRKSAAAGFYTMLAPESIGGGGLPFVGAGYVLESLYRKVGPGRLFIGWSNAFLTQPVLASFVDGPSHMFLQISDAIRTEILPQLVTGEKTICFALTEPDAGSDLWGLKTRARRDGDEWVISGTKQWITNAPYADYAAVFAVTNEELFAQHKGGITAFLVDAKTPGYNVENILSIMGHAGGDCGTISLDEVRVRSDYMIGALDRGFDIGMFGISEGRLGIAGGCLGMAEWALDRCIEYMQQRRTFGSLLSEHQALQFMLAEMAMEIYATKYMSLHTAELVDNFPKTGRLPVKEISIAKAFSVEMTQRAFDRAIQIHGAMGLSTEMKLEEGFRIARTLRIPDGTSEIQRRTVARALLRGDTVF